MCDIEQFKKQLYDDISESCKGYVGEPLRNTSKWM